MKNVVALAAVMALGLVASNAQAATLEFNLNSDGSTSFVSGGAQDAANVVLSNANLTNQHEATIVSAPPFSVNNVFQEPTVTTLFGGSYLAVQGLANDVGHATFNIASAHDDFGFTWGTIDTYNNLVVSDGVHSYTFTGSQILGDLGLTSAASGLVTSQVDISFFDPSGDIKTAVFSTPKNSFEVANFYQGQTAVPLPPSAILFMTGLLGLGLVAYRRQQKAQN